MTLYNKAEAQFRENLRSRRPNDLAEIPEGLSLDDAERIAAEMTPWPMDVPDNVNSPAHYKTGGIECFDAMRAMLTDEEMIGYLRGNSFKYRWRFRHKGGAEDLRKAEWYERKLIEIVDNSA
jgi:hypothetical protein